MGFLDNYEIRSLLNLKGSDLIQPAVAERQLEVIRKGFNFLHQPENNALYIADEVGLGKTYIALGIASLMRHFSPAPESYQDVIFVPKENLQLKWAKEIKQFIHHNYLLHDNRVRSVIGNPVGSILVKETLSPINSDVPGYHIYRNSSLSFGLQYNSQRSIRDSLLNRLSNPVAIDILNRADELGYFYVDYKDHLKRLYSYVLSINNPPIELLIVDEGHNFKYGLGDSDDSVVADRNNVATRFLGIRRNSEIDREIFEDFPDLKRLIKPKVEKLIVLSATPKTYELMEIKRQFDCFLPSHILSDAKIESDVEARLSRFLIRGKMEYKLGNGIYSRNQCRYEHRKGNVVKAENAECLKIKDDEQALVMGLLQYNTIKYLNDKHNATFELGMLAGFETFKLDQQKKLDDQEFEETRTKKINKSQDYEILSKIINSYKDEFGSMPPHPKQDAIVEAVFDQMKRGEKSLVFVRRVASAYELERRLLDKWEKEVVYSELKNKWKYAMKSPELDMLINAYEDYVSNRSINENLDSIFTGLAKRLNALSDSQRIKDLKGISYSDEILKAALYFVYNKYKSQEAGKEFYNYIAKQVNLDNYKSDFLDCSRTLIANTQKEWSKYIGREEEDLFEDEDDESYYFHSFFRQPSNKYFRKSRIYQTDWFDINFFLLNEFFKIASFELEPLKKENIHTRDKSASDLREVQEIYLKYLKEEDYQVHSLYKEDYPSALVSRNTLITELLTSVFYNEINLFLEKLKRKNRRKIEIFNEIKTLSTIIKSTIRNGIGFLPLYIADSAVRGNFIDNYITIVTDKGSIFNHVIQEVRNIINDYELLIAVNFPEKDDHREIESKLIFQSPVKGMSGIKNNKGKIAAQFRMPGYPYVLVTTDIFREGEDLHTYCQNIYHYGIAWNSSDMEQRTGRIDRINSLSNREMIKTGKNEFQQKIHVFCPYLEKTLEVNQVNKLFTSLNSFTRAFDIVESLADDGTASIKSAIEDMPDKIDAYLKSKFEHDKFLGYQERGKVMRRNEMIGSSREDINNTLFTISAKLESSGKFYLSPQIDYEDFKIIGDYNLQQRNNRRGPFRVLIINDEKPGYFKIEVSGILFRVSSKVQKAFKAHPEFFKAPYKLIDIDDFHAFALYYSLENLNLNNLAEDLMQMVEVADEWEERIIKHDSVIFG